jgi:hypothetical protein
MENNIDINNLSTEQRNALLRELAETRSAERREAIRTQLEEAGVNIKEGLRSIGLYSWKTVKTIFGSLGGSLGGSVYGLYKGAVAGARKGWGQETPEEIANPKQ